MGHKVVLCHSLRFYANDEGGVIHEMIIVSGLSHGSPP